MSLPPGSGWRCLVLLALFSQQPPVLVPESGLPSCAARSGRGARRADRGQGSGGAPLVARCPCVLGGPRFGSGRSDKSASDQVHSATQRLDEAVRPVSYNSELKQEIIVTFTCRLAGKIGPLYARAEAWPGHGSQRPGAAQTAPGDGRCSERSPGRAGQPAEAGHRVCQCPPPSRGSVLRSCGQPGGDLGRVFRVCSRELTMGWGRSPTFWRTGLRPLS